MYAKLCSDANKRALEDFGKSRFGFSSVFKYELIKSCNSVLKGAGLLLQTKPHEPCSRADQHPDVRNESASEAFDIEARIRTLGTCRFMGELFMENGFQMMKIILNTVNAFMQANDSHSLECLCVMLSIIGPRFEKVSNTRQNSIDLLFTLARK
ncbi:uncharacterized protein LOC112691972 [Sipha flava]|uniref:Uncharacterized protein LOC112691972 n=1 Tax=Sipha flava TaxID=143950 RepID=A0A8B8GH73_9HEMI|nr:uncharacterized protein LOC112691972 [Sipha flava]